MHYLTISSSGSGFTNQMFALVSGIIEAHKRGEKVVVVGSFLNDVGGIATTPISEVLDIEAMNRFLESSYNLILVDRMALSFDIMHARYGTDVAHIDLTQTLRQQYARFGKLTLNKSSCNLNHYKGDPCPKVPKQLFLRYKINGHMVEEVYDENFIRPCVIDFRIYPKFRLGWITNYNSGMFDRLLCNILYHKVYVEESKSLTAGIDSARSISVVHLRLEDDGITHWSKMNAMSCANFRHRLEQRYIDLIDCHIPVTDAVIVLSASHANRVVDHLTFRGHDICLPAKTKHDREKNAILDLLAARRCNSVFICNFNFKGKNGSTFSYLVGKRMRVGVKMVCVDLDNVKAGATVIN